MKNPDTIWIVGPLGQAIRFMSKLLVILEHIASQRRKEDDLESSFSYSCTWYTHTYTVVLLFFDMVESLILGMGFQNYNLVQLDYETIV